MVVIVLVASPVLSQSYRADYCCPKSRASDKNDGNNTSVRTATTRTRRAGRNGGERRRHHPCVAVRDGAVECDDNHTISRHRDDDCLPEAATTTATTTTSPPLCLPPTPLGQQQRSHWCTTYASTGSCAQCGAKNEAIAYATTTAATLTANMIAGRRAVVLLRCRSVGVDAPDGEMVATRVHCAGDGHATDNRHFVPIPLCKPKLEQISTKTKKTTSKTSEPSKRRHRRQRHHVTRINLSDVACLQSIDADAEPIVKEGMLNDIHQYSKYTTY